MSSLAEAEAYLRGGIPLILSIGLRDEAESALVLTGMTAEGQMIVHDPAADDVESVSAVCSRAQLERWWLGDAGGVVTVVHTPGHPTP